MKIYLEITIDMSLVRAKMSKRDFTPSELELLGKFYDSFELGNFDQCWKLLRSRKGAIEWVETEVWDILLGAAEGDIYKVKL